MKRRRPKTRTQKLALSAAMFTRNLTLCLILLIASVCLLGGCEARLTLHGREASLNGSYNITTLADRLEAIKNLVGGASLITKVMGVF